MKSVKPGRGPSFLSAWGALVVSVFGVFWTVMAVSMHAPVFFPIFGGLFVLTGIGMAVYHFKNATGKNRYSTFDITSDKEEPDPLNARFGTDGGMDDDARDSGSAGYCPYCGAPAEQGYAFCRRCGKPLN